MRLEFRDTDMLEHLPIGTHDEKWYQEDNPIFTISPETRRKHVAIRRGVLRFEFTGKSGKQWMLRVEDKRIASIVRRCADIPGHELFKYLGDDGEPRSVDSGDVNAYIKDITGEDFDGLIGIGRLKDHKPFHFQMVYDIQPDEGFIFDDKHRDRLYHCPPTVMLCQQLTRPQNDASRRRC